VRLPPSQALQALVAKLKAARDRRIAAGIKCGGRKSHAELNPDLVAAAKALQAERPRLSLRKIAARLAEQGYVGLSGRPYEAMSVRSMLQHDGPPHRLLAHRRQPPLNAGGELYLKVGDGMKG
jgi:hypothetical protein